MLIYTAAYGGLRSGELGALRRKDVDLLHGKLHVSRALKIVEIASENIADEDKGIISVKGARRLRLTRLITGRPPEEAHQQRQSPSGARLPLRSHLPLGSTVWVRLSRWLQDCHRWRSRLGRDWPKGYR